MIEAGTTVYNLLIHVHIRRAASKFTIKRSTTVSYSTRAIFTTYIEKSHKIPTQSI